MQKQWIVSAALAIFFGTNGLLAAPQPQSTHPSKNHSKQVSHSSKTKSKHVTQRPAESVGYPNEGSLVGAAHINTKLPFIRVVPKYTSGDVRWGMPTLVKMVEQAAKNVAQKHPGSVLSLGDISKKNGGDISRHQSHESGRDVDIGFYAVDSKGKMVLSSDFIRFNQNLRGNTKQKSSFDLARNWLFIEKMLTDPHVHVSHIFIADHLRSALLQYAKKRGVSHELWEKAALTLLEPTDTLAHDDHMHVRISCSKSNPGKCIELAKDSPMGAKSAKKHQVKKSKITSAHSTKKASAPDTSYASVQHSSKGAHTKPAKWTRIVLDSSQFKFPALHKTIEAESDAVEVRDALDDSGSLKITE